MDSWKQILAGRRSFLILCVVSGCSPQRPVMNKPPEVTVKTAFPQIQKVRDYDEFTGRTDAIEMVEVRARVTGYLEKVAFREGQEVKKGDLLFEIDSRPFQAQVDQAEAKLKSDEAKLKEFTAEYNRNKILHDRRALSLEELQQSEAKREIVAADILGDKAQIVQAKLDLEFSRIVAPIDGRTGKADVREGNLISSQASGSPVLTTIIPQSLIYAYFDVDERTYIDRLKTISKQEIRPEHIRDAKIKVVMGLADGEGFPFEGEVDFVDNRVSSGTGTIRLRAVFDNSQRLLAPGLFARIRIPEKEPHDAVLIPDMAIGTDQGLKFVWIVDSDGNVSRRDIQTGLVNNGLREVIKGLSSMDQIVVQGIQKVREGAKIKAELVSFDEKGAIVDGSQSASKSSQEKTAEPSADLKTPTDSKTGS